MELQIGNKAVEAEMDTEEFKKSLKSNLDLFKAIKNSTKIIFNTTKATPEKIYIILYSETNWLFFLSNLKHSTKKTITFRILLVGYKDVIRYDSVTRTTDFKYIKLKPILKNGEDFLLVNNLVLTTEAFIDFWLQKRLYNYVKSEFKEMWI